MSRGHIGFSVVWGSFDMSNIVVHCVVEVNRKGDVLGTVLHVLIRKDILRRCYKSNGVKVCGKVLFKGFGTPITPHYEASNLPNPSQPFEASDYRMVKKCLDYCIDVDKMDDTLRDYCKHVKSKVKCATEIPTISGMTRYGVSRFIRCLGRFYRCSVFNRMYVLVVLVLLCLIVML